MSCDWVSKDWKRGFLAGLPCGIILGAGLLGSIFMLIAI